MRLRLLAAAAVLAGSLFAADPGLLGLVQPNSQLMAGVNVEQAMLSPLGQFTLAQQLPDNELKKLIVAAGFDPRRDLREILVSSTGQPGATGGIILARGTFDVPKILEAAGADGATTETYKGVTIATMPKQQPCIAFPDSTLAILGDNAAVRAAIDRLSAPSAISAALAAQVNQLSTTEDAWFVSMAPLAQLQAAPTSETGAGPAPFALMSKIQQASGGVKLGANEVVSLQAVLQTPQDATALATLLKSLPALAQMGGADTERAAITALLQNLNVSADGPITKISLSVPEAQIVQMMQTAHAGQQATIGVDAGALTQRPGRAAETPQRIRVGENVQQTKLIQQPVPAYPPLAKQARITGVVRLNAVIAKDGTVASVTLASGHPLLVPAAMEAVKQWVYQPTLLNGQAVEVVTQIEVSFTLVE
jgi:TonB family protein